MLGSMVTDYFAKQSTCTIAATVSKSTNLPLFQNEMLAGIEWLTLDAEKSTVAELATLLHRFDWAINCIGVIKPYIADSDPQQVERAIRVNALFPQALGRAASETGRRVIQIATDCVYSGVKGNYTELDQHDARDVYGKTKSLGEVTPGGIHHLRCSIIGPELKAHHSLLDWFLGQPSGAQLTGYGDHSWNGVTTYHYARLCSGVIAADIALPRLQHVVPAGTINKADLLRCFRGAYNRTDLHIETKPSAMAIDRTLATQDPEVNRRIWSAAGYPEPPSVPQMIDELAHYDSLVLG